MGLRMQKNAQGVYVPQEIKEGARAYGLGSILSVKDAEGKQIGKKGFNAEQPLMIQGMANRNMIDRYSEVLSPVGCDTKNFLMNPVLLAHHSYYCPIGQVTSLSPEDDGVHFEAWIGDPGKAPLTAMQQEIRSLVAQGILKTVSVGFIPKRIKQAVFTDGQMTEPAVIEAWELLELSIVAVPCNPESVFDLKSLGLSKQFFLDLAKNMGSDTLETASQSTPEVKSVEQITNELAQSSMTVQALVFAKAQFSVETAVAWAKEHGFKCDDTQETNEAITLEQCKPEDLESDTSRTVDLAEGVQAVAGKLKQTMVEGDQMKVEEALAKVIEMLTALSSKVEELGKKEGTEEDPPAETTPPADEMKALKDTVAALAADVKKVSECVVLLAKKQAA